MSNKTFKNNNELLFNSQFSMICHKCGCRPCEIELKSDNEGAELFVHCPKCLKSDSLHENDIIE